MSYEQNEMRSRVIQYIDDAVADDVEINAGEIARKISLLDALHLLKNTWDCVTEVLLETVSRKEVL